MGLYSRDYYRELKTDSGIFGGAPVVKYIIIINVVVYLLQIFVVEPPRISNRDFATEIQSSKDHPLTAQEMNELLQDTAPKPVLQKWLELDTNKVIRGGQVWRLLTHAFCHDRGSVFHILFNMLFLYWFGRTLEIMYGSREFLQFYLTAALVAALAYVGLDLYTGTSVPALGASGAVMAVVMLYTVHFPTETICIFWFFPIQMRWLMALYVIWDLHPVLLTLAGDQLFTGIGHAAHLGGLAFGFVYGWYGLRIDRIWDRIPSMNMKWKRNAHLRLYDAATPDRHLETDTDKRRLDDVLEKISISGQDSLNEEERSILRAASERLKNRTRG